MSDTPDEMRIIMMMIWRWWWWCDSDWCLPPVTPGLCQPPELGPGSWGCPGPAWLWLRLGPVSAGPESAVHPALPRHLLSSQRSQWPGLLAPVSSSLCHPGGRNVKRTLAASSWHQTPAAGCRSRLCLVSLAGFWNYSISWIMVKTWTFWRGQLENFPDSNPFSQYYSNILLAFCLSILQVNFLEI